jgi:hypothetical protein
VTEVDDYAVKVAIEKFGLPPCLHVPIAARDEAAIHTYVGNVSQVLVAGSPNRALVVELVGTPQINPNLPIWRLPEATVLHATRQLWVHVDYRGYRGAYRSSFPDHDLGGLVLDHVMNRRVARLKGFLYLRVVPVSRQANSSSGGLSERWAVDYHGSAEMQAKHLASPAKIQYADLADIVKMLNRKTGGALQDPVNEAQALIRESGS